MSKALRNGVASALAIVAVAVGFGTVRGTACGQNRPAQPASATRRPAAAARPAQPAQPAQPAAPAQNPANPSGGALSCPADMVLAEGEYCTNVDQRCVRWLDETEQMRCAEFAPSRCTGRRRHMAVCVDRYEYPNRAGSLPQVMVSWYEAQRTCAAQGRRLCTQAEWTFACEGPDMNPYPYGRNRDATACRIDHQTMRPDRPRLGNPATRDAESARLYEAVPSGSMARCVSWAGVHDMTGNADEWAVNESGRPFRSALKGGWWGPIRARCRPATTSHDEGFVYYQIGFRCCGDPTPAGATAASAPAPTAPAPSVVSQVLSPTQGTHAEAPAQLHVAPSR